MRSSRRSGRPWSTRAAVPVVAVGLLLGLGAGALQHVSTPAEQTATVTLELSAVSPLLDLSPSALSGRPVAVDTDAQILLSDQVVDPVAQVSGRTPEQVRDDLGATARPLTRVLDLHFRHPDEQAAVAGAGKAAETFLALRQRLVLEPSLQFLEQVASSPLNTTEQSDEPLVDLEGELSQGALSQEDRAAALALQLPSAGTVLQAPRITEADDRGDPEVPLTSGAALGALLGWGLWWSRRQGRPGESGATGRSTSATSALAPVTSPARRRVTWRQRVLPAGILAVAGAAIGSVVAPAVTPALEADVSVLITPLPGAAFDDRQGNALVDLGTEAQLALSDAVLQRVAPARGADPAAVRRRLSVRLVPNAEVVVVRARAGTGERAASVAERIAEATLEERRLRAAATLDRRSELLGTRITRTEVDVERATQAEDLAAVEVLTQRLVKLREELKLLASGAQGPGQVLGTATVVPPATSLVRIGLPLAGLLVGGTLGWWCGRVLGPPRLRRASADGHLDRGSLVAG